MTRFISYCDPELAALEAERQHWLSMLSDTDAALEADPDNKSLLDRAAYIDRGLDAIAARILAREAALDGAAD